MATIKQFQTEEMRRTNPHISQLKSVIETAFYGNNVQKVFTLGDAYELAAKSPRIIALDQAVSHAEELGLPVEAKIIVENGGSVVGRTASARRIFGQNPDEDAKMMKLAANKIYADGEVDFIAGQAVVGLDEEFMVQAHIMMPATESPNLYSWLLNFQILNSEYKKRYKHSIAYPDTDIYIYFNPDWHHPDYPDGLAYFDTLHNCAIILGMQYFGEIKKGTLTLAWATAVRNGFVACHGGLKMFETSNQQKFVASFYGLSGSGKSTLTHAKHNDKYKINVLHDDAFIINKNLGHSIALEPAYFDKTNDYPSGHHEQDYFITVQNCGVTLNEKGHKALVTEDIRNGNGRTVKSRYATPNRIDKIDVPINAVFWIMKDDTLPPIMRIKDPAVAATFGATLVTQRSSAENVKNQGATVVVPYANPFRVYPLKTDYLNFKHLFSQDDVKCYVINTGTFLNQDVTPKVTLEVIEQIVDETAVFEPFKPFKGFDFIPVAGYEVPFEDKNYLARLKEGMLNRINFIENQMATNVDSPLPAEMGQSLRYITALM